MIYLREKIDKIVRGRSNRLLVFTLDIKSADCGLHEVSNNSRDIAGQPAFIWKSFP